MSNIGGWLFSVCAGFSLVALMFLALMGVMVFFSGSDEDVYDAGIGLGEGKE